MQTKTEQTNETFLNYFRRKKGIYSQEDVEKVVAEAKTQWLSQLRKEIEGLKKEVTSGMLEAAINTGMGTGSIEEVQYNQALDKVLNLLQEAK